MTTFKPMLAATLKAGELPMFPCMGSAKLDGVRAVIIDGVVLSRNLKPIPNARVQRRFGRPKFNGFDGELIVGKPTDKDCYRNTMSGVMSRDGEPDVTFFVFDDFSVSDTFEARFGKVRDRVAAVDEDDLQLVYHTKLRDEMDLQMHEEGWLADGFEGLMVRSIQGGYKQGRATVKEGTLLKVKRFLDDEAIVIGFEEQMHNANEAVRNKLGQLERSSKKAGKQLTGALGALIVKSKAGVEFKIGTGFTAAERSSLWLWRDELVGLAVKYKYFPTGSKDRPRFPTFIGWRNPIDL